MNPMFGLLNCGCRCRCRCRNRTAVSAAENEVEVPMNTYRFSTRCRDCRRMPPPFRISIDDETLEYFAQLLCNCID